MESFGDIYIASGAQTLALSTTAVLLSKFSATGGANGQSADKAVQPDKENNRVKVTTGKYFVDAWAEVTADAEADIILRVRKNGSAIAGVFGTAPAQQVIKTFTPSLSPAAVAQQTTAEQDLTVTGLLTTDKLLSVIKPTAQAGLGIAGARIKAADTLSVNFVNAPAGGNITPTATETYKVIVGRFQKTLVRAFGFISVSTTDIPGTIPAFSYTSASGFNGSAGSPYTMVPIDVTLESSTGTPTVTISAARLALWKL